MTFSELFNAMRQHADDLGGRLRPTINLTVAESVYRKGELFVMWSVGLSNEPVGHFTANAIDAELALRTWEHQELPKARAAVRGEAPPPVEVPDVDVGKLTATAAG